MSALVEAAEKSVVSTRVRPNERQVGGSAALYQQAVANHETGSSALDDDLLGDRAGDEALHRPCRASRRRASSARLRSPARTVRRRSLVACRYPHLDLDPRRRGVEAAPDRLTCTVDLGGDDRALHAGSIDDMAEHHAPHPSAASPHANSGDVGELGREIGRQ
jgi:hypothetical protein